MAIQGEELCWLPLSGLVLCLKRTCGRMRGLTRMKGRAAVNLSCGDKEEEVSLSEVRLIEFAPTLSCHEMASFITPGTPNLSRKIREVLKTLKKHFWVPHCLLQMRLRSQTKHICTVSESKSVSVTRAQAHSTAYRHTRITETQHSVQTRDSR